ncbi:Talin-2 [Liparis tanakae]|uniref:Talin-2 n=1 Tax=Liparis tanakae TaxID=230148 RepID=A0A4Z2FJR2_9TELE|nr:Talin-2 [Liparis tanakae]
MEGALHVAVPGESRPTCASFQTDGGPRGPSRVEELPVSSTLWLQSEPYVQMTLEAVAGPEGRVAVDAAAVHLCPPLYVQDKVGTAAAMANVGRRIWEQWANHTVDLQFCTHQGVLVGEAKVLPTKMVALSLKICVRQCNVVKTMQFEPSTPVYDACRIIRERVPEAQTGQDYGLFLSDDDPRKGIWLESGRTLDYYMLRNGVRLSHRV